MSSHHVKIQQHASGNKKNAHEHIPERNNISKCLRSVFRIRDNQSCQKCPQSKGKTCHGTYPGDGKTYYHYTQQEKFAISCLCYLVQEKRNYIACAYKSEKNEPNSSKHKLKENISDSCLSCKKRSKDNYQNRSYILKNKDSKCNSPVRTVDLPLLLQQFQDNSCAAKRHNKPHENCSFRRITKPLEDDSNNNARNKNLQPSPQKYDFPELQEFAQGKF